MKTVEQAYLEKQNAENQIKGATESTRSALSTIKRRNFLKTKEETARIKRDEKIAAEQVAANVALNNAAGAVTMAKTETSTATRQDRTRRDEVLNFLNAGIYDPSFAGILGMDDSIVKAAAEKKDTEYRKAQEAKTVAKKAKEEYEAALAALKGQDDEIAGIQEKRNIAQEKVADAVAAFEAENETVENAEDAKTKITVEAALNTPTKDQALEIPGIVTDPQKYVQNKIMGKSAVYSSPIIKTVKEDVQKLKEAAEYYDRLLTEKIAAKEKAKGELSTLEEAYKTANENSSTYRINYAKAAMVSAETQEEYGSAFQDYAEQLVGGIAQVGADASAVLAETQGRMTEVQQLTEEEQKGVADQKAAVQSMLNLIERELKETDLSVDMQDYLTACQEGLQKIIDGCAIAEDYAVHYEENKNDLIYAKMDAQYGGGSISLKGLEEYLEALKTGRKNRMTPLSMEEDLAERKKIEWLELYIERRKSGEDQSKYEGIALDELMDLPGGTLSEKYNVFLSANKQFEDVVLGDYREVAFKTDMNSQEGQDLIREESTVANTILGIGEETMRNVSMGFHSLLIPETEKLFSEAELEQYAAAYAKDFNTGELPGQYMNGRKGVFSGDYMSFYSDIPDFVEGKYGRFTEQEAKRILALLETGHEDTAFDYYAAVFEKTKTRAAEDLNGLVAAGAGLVSGAANFIANGTFMLENALTGSYARTKGNIFTASHQVTMEKLDEMGIAGDGLEFLYMAGYSVFDMLPAVALGAVDLAAPGVGSTLASGYLFAKTMAQTYDSSIKEGKRADEALTYSVLSATSEVVMEKLLTNLPGIGGTNGLASKLDNAIERLSATENMKKLLKIGTSFGSEGTEEFLQEVISPFLEKVAADLAGMEDYELEEIDWDEAIKSFVIGAIAGGAFGSVSAISNLKGGGLKITEAQRALEDNSAIGIINTAAGLGSQRAQRIKAAIQSETPRYEGQEGLFAFASPADIVNITQSYQRNNSKAVIRAVNNMVDQEFSGASPVTRIRYKRIFRKVATGHTLTVKEAASILKNPMLTQTFEQMVGMKIDTMTPEQVTYLARLAQYTQNGGQVQQRLKLFKDVFGEIDFKTLKKTVQFSDLTENMIGGVLYENDAIQAEIESEEFYANKKTASQHIDANGPSTTSEDGAVKTVKNNILNFRRKRLVAFRADAPIPQKVSEEYADLLSWNDINRFTGNEKRNLIKKIGAAFDVFKEYTIPGTNLSFQFSRNNFRESYGKQKRNYELFAKMFSAFGNVIQNAIPIETHLREGYKSDATLKKAHLFLSGFIDGDAIVPVKLLIKEFKDKPNALYVAISLEKIKIAEVSKQGTTKNGVAQGSRSAIINIADLIRKINPKDITFFKYIPNEFLTDEQITVKEVYFKRDTAHRVNDVARPVGNALKNGVFVNSIPQTSKNVYTDIERRETVEVMKLLSQETGVVYMITNKYDTGTFLSADLMAVKPGDLNKGIYHQIAKASYFRVFQMNKDAGKELRTFILSEVEKQIGAEAMAAEIKKIRQQNTVDGKDLLEEAAKDELCSRWLTEILLKNAEGFAKENPDAANLLRKAMMAANEHLEHNVEQTRMDPQVASFVTSVLSMKDRSKINKRKLKIESIDPQHFLLLEETLKRETGKDYDLSEYEVWFLGDAIQHENLRHGESGKHDHSMSDPKDYALIPWVLNHAKNAVVLKNEKGNPSTDGQHHNSDGSFAYQVKLWTKIGAKYFYIVECVPDSKTKRIYIKSAYKNSSGNVPLLNMESNNSPQLTPEAPSEYYATTVNNSISTFSKNVNTDFAQQVVDRLAAGIKGYRAEQFGYRDGDTVSPIDSDFDPDADWDGYAFTHSDAGEVKAENDGADFAKNFDNLTPEERQQEMAKMRGDIDSYMNLLSKTAEVFAPEQTSPEDKVSAEMPEDKKKFKEKMVDAWNFLKRKFVDSGTAVYDMTYKGRADRYLYMYYNAARASTNAAENMITNFQADILGKKVGKSHNDIWKPIQERGKQYCEQFQLYLLHLHNVDRMSRHSTEAAELADMEFQAIKEMYPELNQFTEREIRGIAMDRNFEHPLRFEAQEFIQALDHKEQMRNIQNKPIFDYDVTAEASRMESERLLREHPEFAELAKDVYLYRDNLMQYRVDSGLISKEFAQKLQELYPHYVPTGRIQDYTALQRVKNYVAVGKTVKKAIGGTEKIIPLHKQFADQTLAVVREGSKNRFGQRLLELSENAQTMGKVTKVEKTSDLMSGLLSFEGQIDETDPFKQEEYQNVFAVYRNGEQYRLEVTPDLYEAVTALSPTVAETNILVRGVKKVVDVYKRLITGWNPAFAVRNFSRDMQDSLFFTKDLNGFIRNYLPAWQEMVRDGELWQQYKALGGLYSTIFDYSTGTVVEADKVHQKVMSRVEMLNMMIEQAPRFSEFMVTVKKGDGSMENLMEAMYNAADVTTNFGRSGTWGKIINSSFVPFFNPGIQGFSKICRTLTETRGFRPWAGLIMKAAMFGVLPTLLNGLLYGDDEEWELIKQRDKDVNYLFKIGDGLWLKIPKGRVLSVIGMAGDRVKQFIEGEDIGWGEFFSTAGDQILPANPLTDNVLAAATFAVFNKNWYGEDIVSDSLAQLPVEEQYDASTDQISIWLGDIIDVPPKKINYLLDQYTGVVGDIILPTLTVANEQNFITKAFTINSEYSNRLSSDFYDTLDTLERAKNSRYATVADQVKYRFWNSKAEDLSAIYKEIQAIEADDTLSKADKDDQLKVLYASRNALILQAEDEYGRYIAKVDELAEADTYTGEDASDHYYREANREVFGAEYALKTYNKNTYVRAVKAKDEQDIDFDIFYEVYFDKSADTDKALELISAGFEKESALTISRNIEALEPEDGEESISYLQKYKAIAGSNATDTEKLAAMDLFASDTDRRRVTIGTEYDVTLDQFITIKENIEVANAAVGKKSASNARIQAAIQKTDGLSDRQRAVMWQLFTGSDSAKNNPFSTSVGWETLTKVDAYKAAQE